jgi:hypothetical protein
MAIIMENTFEARYIDKLNNEILSRVDFDRIDHSANSVDTHYAVGVLREMHQAFTEVYGTDMPENSLGFVTVPAVLRGCVTGRLAVGLVTLDLESAGEHYGSNFFTKAGVIDDGARDNSREAKDYLKKHFKPYDYWYTVDIEQDHHVDFDRVPEAVANILNQVQAEPQQGMEMR